MFFQRPDILAERALGLRVQGLRLSPPPEILDPLLMRVGLRFREISSITGVMTRIA